MLKINVPRSSKFVANIASLWTFNFVGHFNIEIRKKCVFNEYWWNHGIHNLYQIYFPLQHDLLQSEHTGRHYFRGSGEAIRQEQVWQRPSLDHKNSG